MKFLRTLIALALAVQTAALSIGGKHIYVERGSGSLQDIVSSPGSFK
jgi:hypothetical protein